MKQERGPQSELTKGWEPERESGEGRQGGTEKGIEGGREVRAKAPTEGSHVARCTAVPFATSWGLENILL